MKRRFRFRFDHLKIEIDLLIDNDDNLSSSFEFKNSVKRKKGQECQNGRHILSLKISNSRNPERIGNGTRERTTGHL